MALDLQRFDHAPPPLKATFRSLNITGSITAHSSSLLLPLDARIGKVQIFSGEDGALELYNVSLKVSNYASVQVDGGDLELSDGRGFYATMKYKGQVMITFPGNTTITGRTEDGNIYELDNVRWMRLEDESIILLMRQPWIKAQGTVKFKELYSTGTLYQRSRAYGQDLEVEGNIETAIYLSDTYTWAEELEATGTFKRTPPIIAYDELTSLPHALFRSIILAPIFLTIIILSSRERKTENS